MLRGCDFNVNKFLLGFIDRGVITMCLFCEIGVGVEMYGMAETEVSSLRSFFFFVGHGVNANKVGGVSPR